MTRRGAWLLLVLAAVGTAGPAAAQAPAPPELAIKIERFINPNKPSINDLDVDHDVTITDKATGQPPTIGLEVFGIARDDQGKESQAFPCEERSANDPTIPRGVYYCPVYVDRGGTYEFIAVVNKLRPPGDEIPVEIARASAPFVLEANTVYQASDEGLGGDLGTVALLWGHVLLAGLWFPFVGALAALGVPFLRRRLSGLAINRLEWRLDLLVRVTWAFTASVIATGTMLLLSETAYDAPFSSSEIDGVFALPYGKPYFLTLWIKIGMYALMVLSVIPLVHGARVQSRMGLGMSGTEEAAGVTRGSAGSGAPAGVLVADAPAVARTRSSMLVRISAVVMLVGLVAISLCVTLLKYFHQLIEAGIAQAGG